MYEYIHVFVTTMYMTFIHGFQCFKCFSLVYMYKAIRSYMSLQILKLRVTSMCKKN